jgi:5-methyltetrahydropteroyltriglutamate--homocysteine methyltransferase
MERSQERILTTHVGSLPREPLLRDLLVQHERESSVALPGLEEAIENGVAQVVSKQLDAGVDIGNNGEQPRVGFSTYVASRMSGFGGEGARPASLDAQQFPDHAAMLSARLPHASMITVTPQALSDVRYVDLDSAAAEYDQFIRISDSLPTKFVERFMTAASPGIIATTMMNAHYDSHASYLDALSREMKKEYELIHARGLLLQLDCPDLAMERTRFFKDSTLAQFQDHVAMHVDAINRAIENIPADRVRLHVCWGNTDSPHIHDVPLEAILPLLYDANVGALSIELANPRHQHEYKVFRRHPLPDSMLLLPGVIDTTANYVEHPEVVADRICQVVDAVGDRARVIASSDCGFGTFAGFEAVAASVVWYKLRALHDGAAVASSRLW